MGLQTSRERAALLLLLLLRTALVIALALAGGIVRAAPYVYPYNAMTGAEVVRKLTTRPASDADYAERDQAFLYVAGVKDATQGSAWCFQGALKPDELTYDLAFALKQQRTPAELKGAAAPLLVEELRRLYPCKSKRPSR